MVNFALVQVTLPGNVELASQVFKPLVSWSFINVKGIFMANQTLSEQQSESHLEYFGQRQTLGYTNFSLLDNLGFLAIAFIFYLAKIGIVILLFFSVLCWKARREQLKEYYKGLIEQIVFDDLLSLYLRSMLEFGSALFLSFLTPSDVNDFSSANFIFAAINLGFLALAIPYVYFQINREVDSHQESMNHFKERFGIFFLGAKVDTKMSKKNIHLKHISTFFFVRIMFLMTVFLINHTGF